MHARKLMNDYSGDGDLLPGLSLSIPGIGQITSVLGLPGPGATSTTSTTSATFVFFLVFIVYMLIPPCRAASSTEYVEVISH